AQGPPVRAVSFLETRPPGRRQLEWRDGPDGARPWGPALAAQSQEPAIMSDHPTEQTVTNRLAGESSPYLLLHQHNPVDWYPWSEEALERARSEDKPIFLSVRYS